MPGFLYQSAERDHNIKALALMFPDYMYKGLQVARQYGDPVTLCNSDCLQTIPEILNVPPNASLEITKVQSKENNTDSKNMEILFLN